MRQAGLRLGFQGLGQARPVWESNILRASVLGLGVKHPSKVEPSQILHKTPEAHKND